MPEAVVDLTISQLLLLIPFYRYYPIFRVKRSDNNGKMVPRFHPKRGTI